MNCSPPLRYDQILFRDREVFEFTHIPGNHRNGVDTQETIGKGLLENPELMRNIAGQVDRGEDRAR
ncbi:MAG: hypothetical protein ACXQTG_06995 [Methanoculleaceae archaeon]